MTERKSRYISESGSEKGYPYDDDDDHGGSLVLKEMKHLMDALCALYGIDTSNRYTWIMIKRRSICELFVRPLLSVCLPSYTIVSVSDSTMRIDSGIVYEGESFIEITRSRGMMVKGPLAPVLGVIGDLMNMEVTML